MAAPALAPGLQRKLRKVLDTRTEAPELASSLATLSSFYGDNTPAARRQLRSTIENEALGVNQDFLAAAAGVVDALDAVQADLDAVAGACEAMTSWVLDNKAASGGLLLETARLEAALATSATRAAALGTFLARYQLAPAEAAALQADPITPEFFDALDHVREVHANCRSLLRTHHQRAGLDLLDSMASLQEAAFQRLCRWVQAECRGLADGDAPDVDPLLSRAAAALRARPVLFRYCAEEVAAARQGALFQRFIRALTRGARPIEMNAPDPWRYASDMLAWVHTQLASEREFLVSLLGEDDEAGEGEGGEGVVALAAALATVFEGVCRPLRVRLEQVLMSSPPPLLAFRLSQLVAFHLRTADAALGVASPLSDTLRACHAAALRAFHEHLRHRGDRLGRHPPPPPPDLSLPPALAEGAALAAELVASAEGSLVEDAAEFDAALAAVIDPLVVAAQRASEALDPRSAARVDEGAHLDPSDQAVFVVNCLQELERPLVGHACAAARLGALRAAAEAQLEALAAGEVARTLGACGLGEVADRLRLYQRSRAAEVEGVPAGDPALALPRVAEAARGFFALLSDPDALPEFAKLRAPALKKAAVARALGALADAYAEVYAAVTDPASGYGPGEAAAAMRRTPDEVHTLLGVGGGGGGGGAGAQ